MNKMKGFTLIELVIALAIFALIAAIINSGLYIALSTQSHLQQKAEKLAELQTAIAILDHDVRQYIERPILDSTGAELPALMASNVDNGHLEFTHTGYINPMGIFNRSTLQRVAYKVENGNLIRMIWPVLDRTPATVPSERVLVHNVQALEIALLIDNQQLIDASQSMNGQKAKAIFLTITLNDTKQIKRVYALHES